MTQRLIDVARSNWVTIDGEAAMQGIELLAMPISRFLNAVYHRATRNSDEAGIRAYNIKLWMPPRGVVATEGPWSVEGETSAFKGLKAALGLTDAGRAGQRE